MDNAKIHMYRQLEDAIATRGALLFYLPPYSPQLTPIEVGFSLIKRWVERHANLTFPQQPDAILQVAFFICAQQGVTAVNLYNHCGYEEGGHLRDEMFNTK